MVDDKKKGQDLGQGYPVATEEGEVKKNGNGVSRRFLHARKLNTPFDLVSTGKIVRKNGKGDGNFLFFQQKARERNARFR